ncbi:MAG: hypothetical protein KDD25_01650 [Bdellovibrionales bacterium]|nr:hypothetical protein [Bdellovibrionales bacterium]
MSSNKKKNLTSDFTKFLMGGSQNESKAKAETNPQLDDEVTRSGVHDISEEETLEVTSFQKKQNGQLSDSKSEINTEKSVVQAEPEKTSVVKSSAEPFVAPEPVKVKSSDSEPPKSYFSSEAVIAQSAQIKVFEKQVEKLNNEVEFLRTENDRMMEENATLRKRLDTIESESAEVEKNLSTKIENLKEEKEILADSLRSKDSQLKALEVELEESKNQVQLDIRRIRRRERELENQIEIIKSEKSAISNSKDQTILELKRKIDQLLSDIETYREKGRKVTNRLESNEERIQRSVRALRLALQNLENESDSPIDIKKAE